MQFNPDEDSVTHINIYSQAKTELGVLLSNFTKTPFVHPKYGLFQSMEGYYYFVSTGTIDSLLQSLYGVQAKNYGRTLPRADVPDFEVQMRFGLRLKVDQNKHIKDKLQRTTLPFVHYYNYAGKVVVPTGNDWLIDEITKIREELQAGY